MALVFSKKRTENLSIYGIGYSYTLEYYFLELSEKILFLKYKIYIEIIKLWEQKKK
jgi:hypothetical protein